jgi:FkbM family methyltransferase
MSKEYLNKLYEEIERSLPNDFIDNFDEVRYSNSKTSLKYEIRRKIKQWFLSSQLNRFEVAAIIRKSNALHFEYGRRLDKVYTLLTDKHSKDLFIKLIAYHILGHRKVKLPGNSFDYFEKRASLDKLFDKNKFIEANFLGTKKPLFMADLSPIGVPLKLYLNGIMHQFVSEQYNYQNTIKVEQGDVVLDCGVCYGDTALHFSWMAGKVGKVIGFEFIPSNLDVIKENLELNQHVSSNVTIVNKALWDRADLKTYYKDMGPGSKVSFDDFTGSEGSCETTTIDETVKNLELAKVDLIKMDIEGAEPFALEGARETILKFRPKLAIASYHSMDDFVNIPLWIDSLNLGYKIYIGHPTIHWEETIVFATVE